MSSRLHGRVGLLVVGALLLVALGAAAAPVRLLVTSGSSMHPVLSAQDLAVVGPAGRTLPGDLVAYRSSMLAGTVVLHRVVAVRADGSLVTKGDNNSWLDPDEPSQDDVVGRLVLRVPGGGVWLDRLTSPTLLGVVAFVLIAVTGNAAAARRSRRSRRKTGRPLPRPLSLL